MGHAEQFKWHRHEVEAGTRDGDPMRPRTGVPERDAEQVARAARIRASLMAYHPHQALGLRLKGRVF